MVSYSNYGVDLDGNFGGYSMTNSYGKSMLCVADCTSYASIDIKTMPRPISLQPLHTATVFDTEFEYHIKCLNLQHYVSFSNQRYLNFRADELIV